MPSSPRRAPMRLLILLSSTLLTAGCAGTQLTPPILDALDCSRQIPDSYRHPVPSAGLIERTDTVGALAVKYDAQTSALDQANTRTADVIKLIDLCKTMQQRVLAALNRPHPWWRIWKP